MAAVSVALAALALGAGACSSRGSVTFQIDPPVLPVFNPLQEKGLSEYELQTTDGTLVGVATVAANNQIEILPLGPLQVTQKPEDVVMSLFSGSQLLGMARIRDVEIQKQQQKTFDAFVRKPLVFVGAALPAESATGNAVAEGQILDFTSTSSDLAHPDVPDSHTPKLPDSIAAAAVTSDGTLLLAGRKGLLTIYDTGTGGTQDLPLPFTPARVVVAPRDSAAVALDAGDASGGGLALFRDLAMLRNDVAGTSPLNLKLPNVNPRAAVFSSDGETLYVLGGGSVDPCGPGTPPKANTITLIGVTDGTVKNTWNMPDFVSDLGVDNVGVLVSRSVAGQVSRLTTGTDSSAPATQKIFDAVCPTALHVTNGAVVVVTAARDSAFSNAFVLVRARLDGSTPTQLPIGAPTYEVPTGDNAPGPSPAPNQPMVSITLEPQSLYAYDLAVTPDGQRAVFGARLRYTQAGSHFTILGIDCTATLDVVEYGLYTVDTASGNASYEPRSQIVTNPESMNDPCVLCPLVPGEDLPFYCPSAPGDRAAGLAAIFGSP